MPPQLFVWSPLDLPKDSSLSLSKAPSTCAPILAPPHTSHPFPTRFRTCGRLKKKERKKKMHPGSWSNRRTIDFFFFFFSALNAFVHFFLLRYPGTRYSWRPVLTVSMDAVYDQQRQRLSLNLQPQMASCGLSPMIIAAIKSPGSSWNGFFKIKIKSCTLSNQSS